MKELSIEEVKQLELNLLTAFDELCSQEGWRYSLGGGSLLGAVRHKGFIPWDDDIDVIMPRPDYDQLVEYSKYNTMKFVVMTHETTPGYNILHGKIVDPKTIVEDITIHFCDCIMGVNIDIFPIEGLGNLYEEAINTFRKTAFRRELLNAITWKKFFKSKTHSIYYEPFRLIMFLLSRLVKANNLLKSIDKENRKREFDNIKYAGCVAGCCRTKEILPQKVFAIYCDIPFENRIFKCIYSFDEYLNSIYGDYMKLPPVEKRVSHHTFRAFLREL